MSERDERQISAPVLGRWPSGVNNVLPDTDIQRGREPALRSAVNVDIQTTGRPRRRSGYEKKVSGDTHSLWAPENWPYALLVKDAQLSCLKLVDGVEVVTPLLSVAQHRVFSFDFMNDAVYGSNGAVTVKVNALGGLEPWGVELPAGQPTLSESANGGLHAGRYQVAITFESDTGEESGSEEAVLIDVGEGKGILLSNIPQPSDPSVALIRVYMSPVNGDALYYAGSFQPGVLSATLSQADVDDSGKMLETMLHDRVKPSKYVASYRGRIYFASGNTMFYTAALRPGLFRLHENYFRFPHAITGVMPSIDGVFVGTERLTYFLGGNDPKDMTQQIVDAFGVIPRTYSRVKGQAWGDELSGIGFVPVWWNTNGELIRGQPGGVVGHLTHGKLALPGFVSGATMQRETGGISQLVSVLRGPVTGGQFAARDTATATVIRNGIEID